MEVKNLEVTLAANNPTKLLEDADLGEFLFN